MRIPKSFLLAFFTILMLSTHAQWQGTGTIYYNGGNVGIGTSTPETKFHVSGDIIAGTANGGYHLVVNDVVTARWALGTGVIEQNKKIEALEAEVKSMKGKRM